MTPLSRERPEGGAEGGAAASAGSEVVLIGRERTRPGRVAVEMVREDQMSATAGAPPVRTAKPSGGNVAGRARCLTLLTPIRPFWVPFLWLPVRSARYHPYFRDHSLQFKFIYYVRWAIFREFAPDEKKRYSYLLFESNFDIP